MIIYKATNKINGKIYVGQTIYSLEHRKRQHISNVESERYPSYFHKAIRKYGKKNFAWEIIHECSNLFELNNMEIFYVGHYDSFGRNGYNLNEGGWNACPSEITKKKMSESSKGSKNAMWGRNKEKSHCWGKRGEGTPTWGKHHSAETKKKIAEANKGSNHYLWGKNHSEETKKKMSDSHKGEKNYWFGKSLSENHKKNMSKAQSGEKSHLWRKQFSDETKKKMSEANKGRKHSEEARKKMSESHIGIRPVNVKPVMINGAFFESLSDAGKFVGVSKDSIVNRIKHKTKWMDYKYV